MELMWSRWLGSKQASPRLELLLSVLNRRRVVPSYTRVTPVGPWSPIPVHIRTPVGLSLFLTYNTSFTYHAGLRLQVLNRLQALGLHLLIPLMKLTRPK